MDPWILPVSQSGLIHSEYRQQFLKVPDSYGVFFLISYFHFLVHLLPCDAANLLLVLAQSLSSGLGPRDLYGRVNLSMLHLTQNKKRSFSIMGRSTLFPTPNLPRPRFPPLSHFLCSRRIVGVGVGRARRSNVSGGTIEIPNTRDVSTSHA